MYNLIRSSYSYLLAQIDRLHHAVDSSQLYDATGRMVYWTNYDALVFLANARFVLSSLLKNTVLEVWHNLYLSQWRILYLAETLALSQGHSVPWSALVRIQKMKVPQNVQRKFPLSYTACCLLDIHNCKDLWFQNARIWSGPQLLPASLGTVVVYTYSGTKRLLWRIHI